MKSHHRTGLAVIAVLALGGCSDLPLIGGADRPVVRNAEADADLPPDTPAVLGEPYAVDGTTYTPADPGQYDAVGYARVLAMQPGAQTAAGEPYRPEAVSGAHKTLPLPSYVEVTSVETGRTILVRLNERGPRANDVVLGLSSGAAEQLGMTGAIAPVRVRLVNPPDAERLALRLGNRAPARLDTPPQLLTALRRQLAGRPEPAPQKAAIPAPIEDGPTTEPIRADQIPPRPAPVERPAPAESTQSEAVREPAGNRDGRFVIEDKRDPR